VNYGGGSYPGANTPAWWYGTTATAGTSNVMWSGAQVVAAPRPAPAKPKTNVEQLRERVAEVCDLAFEVAG